MTPWSRDSRYLILSELSEVVLAQRTTIAPNVEMGSRDELLKPIWHAFTALDVDQSGKVSKSQLKVC